MTPETEKIPAAEKERSYESKEAVEGKEHELSPEAQAAAMKERAEFLVKEVKNNQTMMQNILMNVAQVKQLIQKIRAQLQLVQDSDDPQSVKEDTKYAQELQKQISQHQAELVSMRDDLIRIYSEDIQEQKPELSDQEVKEKAVQFVDSIIEQSQT